MIRKPTCQKIRRGERNIKGERGTGDHLIQSIYFTNKEAYCNTGVFLTKRNGESQIIYQNSSHKILTVRQKMNMKFYKVKVIHTLKMLSGLKLIPVLLREKG